MNENDNALTKPISPLKAIRAKCLDCSCNQINEIKLCSVTNCALYPFRLARTHSVNIENIRRKRKDNGSET